jgi:hypothetical protein
LAEWQFPIPLKERSDIVIWRVQSINGVKHGALDSLHDLDAAVTIFLNNFRSLAEGLPEKALRLFGGRRARAKQRQEQNLRGNLSKHRFTIPGFGAVNLLW